VPGVTKHGLQRVELAAGVRFNELQARTGCSIHRNEHATWRANNCRDMKQAAYGLVEALVQAACN